MSIYTLTFENRPVSTTESLDHATAWKLKSPVHNYVELPHYDSKYLGVTVKGENILIEGTEPDEFIAQVLPEFYNDEGHIGVGRIIVDFFEGSNVNLDKCNFTEDLKREIDSAVDSLREIMQEKSGRDEMHEAWMDGSEMV